jgi:predicted nucleic acid-binding protein
MEQKRMTLTIIDSTVLIDASRQREAAVLFLSRLASEGPLRSSVVVRSELWAGARPEEADHLSDLLDQLRWHDLTVAIADLAGKLAYRYRQSHRIGLTDFIIAATAIELGGTVATLNVRDFPMFPGLQPPY